MGGGVSASQRMTWKPNLVSHLAPYMEYTHKKMPSESNTLHTFSWHGQQSENPVHKTEENKF